MATQSLAMGEAFGLGFQYGKRRISAMSNEEFNKITPVKLHQDMQGGVQAMIPEMKQSISNFTLLQTDIIKELVHYASNIINESPELVKQFMGLGNSGAGGGLGDIGGQLLFEILKGLSGGLITNPLPSAGAENLPPPTNTGGEFDKGKNDKFKKDIAALTKIREMQAAVAAQKPLVEAQNKFAARLPKVQYKRKATQSARMEVKKLTGLIAKWVRLRAPYKKLVDKGYNTRKNAGSNYFDHLARVKSFDSKIAREQKAIIVLYNRYDFN